MPAGAGRPCPCSRCARSGPGDTSSSKPAEPEGEATSSQGGMGAGALSVAPGLSISTSPEVSPGLSSARALSFSTSTSAPRAPPAAVLSSAGVSALSSATYVITECRGASLGSRPISGGVAALEGDSSPAAAASRDRCSMSAPATADAASSGTGAPPSRSPPSSTRYWGDAGVAPSLPGDTGADTGASSSSSTSSGSSGGTHASKGSGDPTPASSVELCTISSSFPLLYSASVVDRLARRSTAEVGRSRLAP
mmetsp:Transcript_25524/g.64200  ORF Transcript_25524/g.64200 Transcript_25524/m.64200 type:complete len:252 (-) Transcript_25524:1538-2293(-)